MAATRRLTKELCDIRSAPTPLLTNIEIKDSNILQWKGLLRPTSPPYDKGSFKIEINFPPEYPFKPPTVTFITSIYHPNIDDKGQICLPIIHPTNWKPATKTDQVIQALLALIHDPEPEHPLRSDLAKEFVEDRKSFNKKAEEFTKKHAQEFY